MLAEGLSTNGFVVASGLARGIDAAAHRAALTRGTVAVFAGGLDRVYPPEHADLARAIVEAGGALVSEMPLGWTARGRDFPRRNRIISGLAMGTVVVEAARRSGSLITGRRAAEQGRAVFAVPGSPLDPRAYGTNLLIKDGAQIVTDVDDIVATVRPMIGEIAPPDAPRFDEPSVAPDARPDIDDPDRDRVLEALGPAPIEVDTIVRATGIPAAAVNVILLELDLAGRLERHAGGRVSLA
jgi:DNA processing protein